MEVDSPGPDSRRWTIDSPSPDSNSFSPNHQTNLMHRGVILAPESFLIPHQPSARRQLFFQDPPPSSLCQPCGCSFSVDGDSSYVTGATMQLESANPVPASSEHQPRPYLTLTHVAPLSAPPSSPIAFSHCPFPFRTSLTYFLS